VLPDNFDDQPDHYVTIQLSSDQGMIDQIGGVDVNVPATITIEHDVTFKAGPQILSGDMAGEYVRAILPGGESARFDWQNRCIHALKAKVLNAGIIPQAPTLLEQFNNAVTTDLSLTHLVDLTCMADNARGNISFYEITGSELVTPRNGGVLIPNTEAIKTYVANLFTDK
jgi:anionic cell wall polymer biosynthesis LytR-Cps2A-Psr (LCP) family protein